MKTIEVKPFYIIGITVRTSNMNNQAANDIPLLWQRFINENTIEQIPSKLSNEIISMYTEYEGDHTLPYTTLLGCKVSSLAQIPRGMTGIAVEGGTYLKFTAKGDLTKGVVIQKWVEIWNQDLARKFTHDYEVYGDKASNASDAEVDIFIAV